jgi:cytoskeleton protein RodZ
VPSSASIPAATAPVIQTQPVPVSATDAKPAAQRLVIHAVEPTWIRVQVDDGQVSEELLPAGAGREWTAARRFVLTVGNAGGLEIDLNGKRMPALGARGAVIQKLVLPPEAQGTGS